MKKIFSVVFLMSILLILSVFIVFATVTYTIIEPDDYNETTNTFFIINWTGTSTINRTYEVGLYLNGAANSSYAACANNSYCNISANNVYVGFWQWYLNFTERNNTANVTTITSKRWLEVRETSNLTFFKWGTPSTDVMWLNKYTGDLNISGIFYSAGSYHENNFKHGNTSLEIKGVCWANVTSSAWIRPENVVDIDYENICSGDACPFAWNISGNIIYPQDLRWTVIIKNVNITGNLTLVGTSSNSCTASFEGIIIYNSSNHKFLGCNSTDWVVLG